MSDLTFDDIMAARGLGGVPVQVMPEPEKSGDKGATWEQLLLGSREELFVVPDEDRIGNWLLKFGASVMSGGSLGQMLAAKQEYQQWRDAIFEARDEQAEREAAEAAQDAEDLSP